MKWKMAFLKAFVLLVAIGAVVHCETAAEQEIKALKEQIGLYEEKLDILKQRRELSKAADGKG